MAETRNYEQFRGLLRGAICDRTQAQFAKESGISPEHLSRMLNAAKIHRPSQATLGKIAAAAKNGVTLQDLLDALDASDGNHNHPSPMRTARAAQDFAMDFEEAAVQAMDRVAGILKNEHWPAVIDAPEDCADNIVAKANEDIKSDGAQIAYDCGVCRTYIGTYMKNVEKYMPVYLSMAGNQDVAESIFIIYYNEMPCADGKTRAVIQGADSSVEAIEDLYGLPNSALERASRILAGEEPWPAWMPCARNEIEVSREVDGETVSEEAEPDDEVACMAVASDMPYDIRFSPLKKFTEKYRGKGKTPEERVLGMIFGERCKWPETVPGFGFWIDEKNPPEKLTAFLANATHRKHILDSYDPEGVNDEAGKCGELEKILDSGDGHMAISSALDEFGYQDPDMLDDAGWASAVATAMRAETGFPFAYHKAAENTSEFDRLSEHGCIIIEAGKSDGISREAMIMATARYAKALGIKNFGDILFTGVHEEFRKDKTYVIREHENDSEPEPESDGNGDEPGWTEFDKTDENKKPKAAGRYLTELKDGRTTNLFWLPGHDIWIRAHKEWSRMVARFIDKPVPLEEDGCPDENDSET